MQPANQQIIKNKIRFLVRGKIPLSKVEHPEYKGHVKSNEDKYQKSVQLKFRHCYEIIIIHH